MLLLEHMEQDLLYLDNLETSVVILRRLSSEWKQYSDKHLASEPLKETLKSFRQKVKFLHYVILQIVASITCPILC